MLRQLLVALGIDEPDVPDHRVRQAVAGVNRVEPPGLGHLIVAVGLGLDMHGRDDPEAGRLAAIVRRQEGLPQGAVVAHEVAGLGLALQPRIAAGQGQVPEVMVGVDDLDVFHGGKLNAAARR